MLCIENNLFSFETSPKLPLSIHNASYEVENILSNNFKSFIFRHFETVKSYGNFWKGVIIMHIKWGLEVF